MRLLPAAALLLAACAPAPPPRAAAPPPDPAAEPAYARDVERLARMAREADELFRSGRMERAQAIVTEAQPIESRVLAVPRPALAALEAASDLDDLYGRMLLRNRHYGWARLMFQKNVVRWKVWQPQTPEAVRRRRAAEAALAECDRLLGG